MPKSKPRLKNAIAKNHKVRKPYSKFADNSPAIASTVSKASKKYLPEPQQPQEQSKSKISHAQVTSDSSQPVEAAPQNHAKRWLKIPFTKHSTILLVGEGDFSYSASLVNMGYRRLMATVYDDEETCLTKYARAKESVERIRDAGGKCEFAVDAKVLGKRKAVRDGWRSLRELALSREESSDMEEDEPGDYEEEAFDKEHWKQKDTKADEGWDTIIFNFPHVGGLSTDVNRQVRHNQELIVSFLKSSLPLLSPTSGMILITTFEGHPYTLWNLRDLARHSGYKVERSWKFCWDQWGGYKHVRTLGDLEGGGGAWKGEDRDARTFCLRHKEWESGASSKRSKSDDSDSD